MAYDSVIICPHCGHLDGDDRYYGEGFYEGLTCGRCGEEYHVGVYVSVSYETFVPPTPRPEASQEK